MQRDPYGDTSGNRYDGRSDDRDDRYDDRDDDRYDRGASYDDASDLGRWEPGRRQRPFWGSGRFAGMLALVLVLLVGFGVGLTNLRLGDPGPNPPGGAVSPSPVAASPSGSVRPSFVRPTPTPLPTFMAYLVRSGDSLNSIADDFGTTARSIAFWNREAHPSLDPLSEDYEPDRIEVGWQLRLIPNTVYSEEPTASAPPSAAPSGPPAATPTPSIVPGGPAAVVSHGDRGSDGVGLTFDMGGRLDPALDIMNWLVANRVKATIFPTGQTASTTEIGRQVLEIVRDHPDLFSLGNHSWDHPNFTELTGAEMRDQLERTESAASALANRTTRPWFRPPFGAWDAGVRNEVGNAGWHSIVMWDVDTIDWRPVADGGPTAADIRAKVLSNVAGGSIVLMHLGGYNTFEALPGIVDGLTDRGLRAVTLDEMFGG
jgi:peptidoglycan/xylan/chitin deacetylase (PgdA/CDA1 family)